MAQSQVGIAFGNGIYNEANHEPVIQLFNDYFSGGMGGLVFQELREARALAYSVGAVYATGSRKGDENIMSGAIGCQADKTPEALDAFLELFEKMPASPDRFADTRDSVISRYRTGKLGFREIIGAVRMWERLEVPIDPRKARFEKVQHLGLDDILQFDKAHLQGRPKLISIVGDKKKIDLEEDQEGRRDHGAGVEGYFCILIRSVLKSRSAELDSACIAELHSARRPLFRGAREILDATQNPILRYSSAQLRADAWNVDR